MNSPVGTKDRPWAARVSLYSGETTSTIEAGVPVVLSSTDPSKVVLPATAGSATANSLFAGVSVKRTVPGDVVEIVSCGYVANAVVVTQTRAASTASYASVAARPAGAHYVVDAARNAFSYSADSAATPVQAILIGGLPSYDSVASNSADTSLYRTTLAKMWIRGLV